MELKDVLKKKYEKEKTELLKKKEADKVAVSKSKPTKPQVQPKEPQPLPPETPPTNITAPPPSNTAPPLDNTAPPPSNTAPPPNNTVPPPNDEVNIQVEPPSIDNTVAPTTGDQNVTGEQNLNESDTLDDEAPVASDMLLLMTTSMSTYDDDEEEGEVQDTPSLHLTATDKDLAKVLPTAPPGPETPSQDTPTHVNLGAPVQNNTAPGGYEAHMGSTMGTYQPPPGSYQPPPGSYQPPPGSYQPPPGSYQAPMGGSHQPPSYSQVPPNHQPPPYVDPALQNPYYRSSSFPTAHSPLQHNPVPSTPPANMGTSCAPSVDRSNKPTTPEINRSLKPHVLTSLGGLEGGVRGITLPDDLTSRFLQLASNNTRRDVETCGILAGKLGQNKLRITHMIIPKQKGKSDSCETLNEEDLFDVQDRHDLITLGWIHTHPSQTSFMSSVDLHTHCSYQLMLEEAIAIVCAPRYSQIGIYTLTQPYGLNYISKCAGKGFHTHPQEPPIYEECKHVSFDPSARVEIIDLR